MAEVNRDIPRISRANDEAPLWRYMDLARYVSMLSTKSLHFTNLRQFHDRYEGRPPGAVLQAHLVGLLNAGHPLFEAQPRAMSLGEGFRQRLFANCWHQNDGESEAMWRIYSLLGEGVAIRTTAARLHSSLREEYEDGDFYAGLVHYGTFQVPAGELGNSLTWAFVKRSSFSHEHEYRVVILYRGAAEPSPTIAKRVNLEDLVLEVIVSPLVKEWQVGMIESVTRAFGLTHSVRRSTLFDEPEPPLPSLSVEVLWTSDAVPHSVQLSDGGKSFPDPL